MGIAPTKKLNTNSIIARLKAQQDEDDLKPVIDPLTVKIRQLNNEIKEEDLMELLSQYGEITRVKIPMNEDERTNKGIGFVTFKNSLAATNAIEEGYIKFEYYELPVERATQSKARMDMQANRRPYDGERRGGFDGERGGRGGFRGGRGGREDGDRDQRERPREDDGGYLKRRTD
jgi:RNA recognition motif-containing protein